MMFRSPLRGLVILYAASATTSGSTKIPASRGLLKQSQLNNITFCRLNHQSKLKHATSKVKRPPVVTIMGHVDHGKTTLLDRLRNSQIVKQEFGGITQHIGAFVVPFKQKGKTELVTFLDTPGHAAFASMRKRGAKVTDMVVLVVACDDGVLDQTIESINYAKDSDVPIIVAVNKVDKFIDEKEINKRVELIRRQLFTHDVVCEAEGGEVQLVKISALTGNGLDDLKESILALAETLMLETEINCPAYGHIIESQVHPHRGKLCTVLVEKGTISKGDILISGRNNWAKVRSLFDERQQLKQSCGPGLPIQVIGWREDDIPLAGDPVIQVDSETEAKSLIKSFQMKNTLEKAKHDSEEAERRHQEYYKLYKEKLIEKQNKGKSWRTRFSRIVIDMPKDDSQEDHKINLLLKCDVNGSLEAILELLDTYDRDKKQLVKLDLMHYGVGMINDNDLLMATSFPNSVIYGFNVKAVNQDIMLKAKKANLPIKMFNVIYHLYDDLKARVAEKMPELEEDIEIGEGEILQTFTYDEKKKTIAIAGSRCTKGTLKSEALYKLIRNGVQIARDLKLYSLKHRKDPVKEIEKDRECGIAFVEEVDFKPGDKLIAYEKRKYKPEVKWSPKGFS